MNLTTTKYSYFSSNEYKLILNLKYYSIPEYTIVKCVVLSFPPEI